MSYSIMDSPHFLRKMAKSRLETCREYEHEEDAYPDFILGKGTFALPQRSKVTGKLEQCTWAVMETIYDDYKAHPELKINEKLQAVLEEGLRDEVHTGYLENAIECLLHQMRGEKQHTVPFALDCEALLNALRENIRENHSEHIVREMMPKLETYNQTFTESYGRSIM